MSYFKDNLNYTLSNEDSLIEQKILPEKAENIFVIGGSGARVLPLLAKKRLSCFCKWKRGKLISVFRAFL